MHIVNTVIVGPKMGFHTARATLSDGRVAEFWQANLGHREYPHALTPVHVFASDHVEGGIVVFHAGDVVMLDKEGRWETGRSGRLVASA